jgi:hypothetical protein
MLKAIAAGSALICATLAWFIFGIMLSFTDPPVIQPEMVGQIAAIMLVVGGGLLVISPAVGLFNWARRKRV